MKNEKMNSQRRLLLLATMPALYFTVRGTTAVAQLQKNVFSEFSRIQTALEKATNLDEIGVVASEWNSIYQEHATAVEPEFATDVQQIVDFINGKITDSIRDAALAEALKKIAPVFFETLSASLSWLKNVGPIILFLEASAPSTIASDSVELFHTNQSMQHNIRAAIDRIIPNEDQWYDNTKMLIKFPEEGPSLGPG